MSDGNPDLSEIRKAVGELVLATADIRVIRDRLATSLYRLSLEENWLVPPSHRPSCTLSGKPCTSWTCLSDYCAEGPHNDRTEGG